MNEYSEFGWPITAVVLMVAGVLGMASALKNARTSDDLSTGRWFTISGFIFIVGVIMTAIQVKTWLGI